MKKRDFAVLLSLSVFTLTLAQTDPEITSWMLNTTSLTGYNDQPANVQNIQYTSDSVWISCSDIPSYSIGPWNPDPNTATDQHFVYSFPRNPQKNSGSPIVTPLGHIALWINGVSAYNAKDANSYNNMNIWHSNAVVVEAASFDNCLGHPQSNGEYHYHQDPVCLYNTSDTTHHSPILGYAFDGYPIYGPYGYANTDGTGGIRRMRSSFRLRNITTRTTLPNGDTLSPSQYGPPVSSSYPLGYYVEDYEYVDGSGDLDRHNGRFCVTPEYPKGTYAYFVTIDSTGASAYPYIIGPTYYGIVAKADMGPNSAHDKVSANAVAYTGTTGIHEINNLQHITVTPNPTTGIAVVSFPHAMTGQINLSVFNELGRSVITRSIVRPGTNYKLDMMDLPDGVYFMRIQNGNDTSVKRILLRH